MSKRSRDGKEARRPAKTAEGKRRKKDHHQIKTVASPDLDYVLSYLSFHGYQVALDSILSQGVEWKAREVKRKTRRLSKWAIKAGATRSLAEQPNGDDSVPTEEPVDVPTAEDISADPEESDQIMSEASEPPAGPLPTIEATIVSAPAEALPTLELKMTSSSSKKSTKQAEKPVRFQRIKVDEQVYHDERLKNMSYTAKGTGARQDDWGAKANADLSVTRGKGFRKEKDKKKRGSYRGGTITEEVHSIRFPGSDSE